MVLQPSHDTESTGTFASRYRLMDLRRVVGGQVVPFADAMVIRPVHAKPFDLCANVVTEIEKKVSVGTYPLDASNPSSRPLDASPSLRWKGRIPRLDGEEDGDLVTVMVVTILPHPVNFEGPPTCSMALLKGDPELVNVDELTSRHWNMPRGDGQVQKDHMRNWTSSRCTW